MEAPGQAAAAGMGPVAAGAAAVMSLSDLAGPACGGRTTRLDKSDAVTSDFWMYRFKIDLCPRRDPHDWEQCLYAHRGEKARRRHPSKYKPVQCPEARAKTLCPRGEDCPCTHNLFEYWLHPDRFRTCICEQGPNCNRPICFFAHCEEERRALPEGSSDPSTLPGENTGRGGREGRSGSGGADRGGSKQARPGTTAVMAPAMDASSGVMFSPQQALHMMMPQAQLQQLQWAATLQGPMQLMLQQQVAGAAGGHALLSGSPALAGASGGNMSYGSLSTLRSHTPSPGLVHQGSGQIMWPESQLMQGGGGMLQPGDEGADAILSFSLWDGDQAGDAAAAAAIASQQRQHQIMQQQPQMQQQQQQQQQQLQQQLRQQQVARTGSGFSGFESWSPMQSLVPSPHSSHNGSVAAAAVLAAAAAASGPVLENGVCSVTSTTTGGTTPISLPTTSRISTARDSNSLLLHNQAAGVAGMVFSGPRATASPTRQQSTASPRVSATTGSGVSTPGQDALAQVQGAATAALLIGQQPGGGVRLGSSVDALAQDLSTLLSPSGLRVLSAKLAALADQADLQSQSQVHGHRKMDTEDPGQQQASPVAGDSPAPSCSGASLAGSTL